MVRIRAHQLKIRARLVLIDGHAILHRAYHAYPPLTTSKGELINAVYGFTSILLSSVQQLDPKYVVVAFDKKAPTFRHKEFKDYKAHRPKVDRELVEQIPRVYEVVKALNIPIFEKEGFEADDIIGTLAKRAKDKHGKKRKSADKKSKKLTTYKPNELEIIIVTGDNDALQLVDNNVRVCMPGRGKMPTQMFDRKTFLKKYGFEPRYLIDFKALAGDASDGIPGVKGIGPKAATALIVKFGTVENIYKNFQNDSSLKASTLKKLADGKKDAKLSKKLATIICNVPIKFNLKKSQLLDYDKEKVLKLFEELEFRSLIRRLPGHPAPSKASIKLDKVKNKDKSQYQLEQDKQMELF